MVTISKPVSLWSDIFFFFPLLEYPQYLHDHFAVKTTCRSCENFHMDLPLFSSVGGGRAAKLQDGPHMPDLWTCGPRQRGLAAAPEGPHGGKALCLSLLSVPCHSEQQPKETLGLPASACQLGQRSLVVSVARPTVNVMPAFV